MPKYINKKLFDKYIKDPDWYLKLKPELDKNRELFFTLNKKQQDKLKTEYYSYFDRAIRKNKIQLNKNPKDWDSKRKPIDTIVIHHTHHYESLTLNRLNAIQLVNLYMPYFQNPKPRSANIKGQPIFSGHYRKGKQVFYAYHWFVRQNGKRIRLLEDRYIGWHSGNRDVNAKSVAICIDGNFNKTPPTKKAIKSVANIINKYYPNIKKENILGHRQINPKTDCPGDTYLEGWKADLFKKITAK